MTIAVKGDEGHQLLPQNITTYSGDVHYFVLILVSGRERVCLCFVYQREREGGIEIERDEAEKDI